MNIKAIYKGVDYISKDKSILLGAKTGTKEQSKDSHINSKYEIQLERLERFHNIT